jgi:hypothetical protein
MNMIYKRIYPAAAAGETVLVTDRGQVSRKLRRRGPQGGALMSNALLAEDVRCGRIVPALDPSWVPGSKVHV